MSSLLRVHRDAAVVPAPQRRQPVCLPLPWYLPWSLAVLWLWSGLQPLFSATQIALDLLAAMGVPTWGQWPLLLAASALDVVFGIACLLPALWRRPRLWQWQLLTVAAYSVLLAFGLPENWLHPFAPLLKNLPIMALLLYLYRYSRSAS